MQAILLIDIGSTYTKVTAVDSAGECLIGTAQACTTASTDVNIGLENAIAALQRGAVPSGPLDFVGRYACSSAAGGLKMIAVGLVPDLTAEAARRAALSAGARVLGTCAYELTAREITWIAGCHPDIILLAGGTDGGNQAVILHNARMLATIPLPFSVVVAGNKSAAAEVAAILRVAGHDVHECANVMPEFNQLNIEPAREVIRTVFLQRIVRAKGLSRVQALVDGILMPTPAAVLQAAQLLAAGSGSEPGLGDLLLLDVGGATTDVYSIGDGLPTIAGVMLKGLPEPWAKRTVEGDLGVRSSVQSLAAAAGLDVLRAQSGLAEPLFGEMLAYLSQHPTVLPDADPVPLSLQPDAATRRTLDRVLGSAAIRLAVARHVGHITVSYSPSGPVYTQTGKDLRPVHTVIGTGGPIIYGSQPARMLAEALYQGPDHLDLRPVEATLLLDTRYILAAMGLLANFAPEKALRILKRELRPLA